MRLAPAEVSYVSAVNKCTNVRQQTVQNFLRNCHQAALAAGAIFTRILGIGGEISEHLEV